MQHNSGLHGGGSSCNMQDKSCSHHTHIVLQRT